MGNVDKFESMAEVYDRPERIETAEIAADVIRQHCLGAEDKNAIDFGCGTGLVGMRLLKNFQSILFLDASQKMIEQVQKKIMDCHIGNATTLCLDLEKEDSAGLHGDYIFMVQVLLHIRDFKPVLSKLYDALNAGGHLIIIDFNRKDDIVSDSVHPGFDQNQLMDEMSAMGYKKLQSRTFYQGTKNFMGQDASMFILDAQK